MPETHSSLEEMEDYRLASSCAVELDRFKRDLPITDRSVIPYFSNILLNTAQKLRGNKPSEPPFRVIHISFPMDLNLFRTVKIAYDEEYPSLVSQAYPLAAQKLEQTARTIRNYKKLPDNDLELSINQMISLSKAIRVMNQADYKRYLAA